MLAKRSRAIFTLSVVILIVCIVLAVWGMPWIIRKQIQKNVQLEESSMMFEKWKKLPIPLDFKIFVFNVTNADDVTNGQKPKLQEIGPYVYKEYREKTILGYGKNDTIEYTLKKTFIFNQEESGALSEDDEVTVINFSYMAAVLAVDELMPSLVGMVNKALEQFFSNLTDPFLRVKVKDLFFDGIFLNCEGDNAALGLVCGKIKAETPPTMRTSEDGKGFYFSMFSHMNRTETGPFKIVRGTENVYDLGNIISYKGKTSNSQWGDTYCGMMNGSDSSIFPPVDGSKIPQRLYTFEPEICRSMHVSYAGQRTIYNMSAIYYEIDDSTLAAKSANPNNKCFCRRNWSAVHDGCLIMGILNVMPCQGAPAIASFPHFYLASEELLDYFAEGIKPDKEKHNTYVYLDPATGVVMKGARRMQFNIELRNIPAAPQLAKVTTGLFPLLWIEEGAALPESIQEELRSKHSLMGNAYIVMWVLVGLVSVVVLGAAVAAARSGALPAWRQSNAVSFMLRHDVDANKVH